MPLIRTGLDGPQVARMQIATTVARRNPPPDLCIWAMALLANFKLLELNFLAALMELRHTFVIIWH